MIKNMLSSTKTKLKKNKKKVVIVLSICIFSFMLVFSYTNLNNPTKLNAYIAHVINKGAPVNNYFDDEIFYKAVVDAYNKENKTSLPYTTNLTDEQLKSIKSVLYSGYKKSNSEKVKSATGIEKLTSLTDLNLYYNKITNIDLSENTLLKTLNLHDNNITNIDLSKNTQLTYLNLNSNNITNIDLSKNTLLTDLYLSSNNITNIDLRQNTQLKNLALYNSNLNSIDLSKNLALATLHLGGNNITSIDLSKNTQLTKLDLGVNITNIDLSKNTLLTSLDLRYSNITNIDLSKNILLTSLDLRYSNITDIDLSKNTQLTDLKLYDNPLKINAYVKENGTLISSNIKMPEGSDKFYLTYDIEDNSIAEFTDGKLKGLKVGKTNATITLNGVNKSSLSEENMKIGGIITVFDRLKGDVNNDDKITISDVSKLFAYYKGKVKLTEDDLLVSDLNNDGKITNADISKLFAYYKGKIEEL